VFNLVAEVLAREVKTGYKFTCDDVFDQVLMYADDGCLLAVAHGDGISNRPYRLCPRAPRFWSPAQLLPVATHY